MIRKLRRKMMIVLMGVVCLFIIGILLSVLLSSINNFERRSMSAMREWPGREAAQQPNLPSKEGIPTAMAYIGEGGEVKVRYNQLYYVTEDELKGYVAELEAAGEKRGTVGEYTLRYAKRSFGGRTEYFFSDTYMERASLNSQLLYSCAIGLGAIALFFVVCLFLSKWMIRPVELTWNRQRQFIADASHELKTPLTVILSNADMLSGSGAVTDEKNLSRLSNIRAESQRMKGLIESLLALARADSRAEEPEMSEVNLSYTVSSSVLTMEPTIYDMGRSIDCDTEDGLMVRGDAARLRQLMDILLDNACKYGLAGSPITVKMSRSGKKELTLAVTSRGAPLTPEECGMIFERFYRSDKSRSEEEGYGLGLSIARSIVSRHGGRIWAASDGKSENTFFVRLPLIDQHP